MVTDELKQICKIDDISELIETLDKQRITSMKQAFDSTSKEEAHQHMQEYLFIDNLYNKVIHENR